MGNTTTPSGASSPDGDGDDWYEGGEGYWSKCDGWVEMGFYEDEIETWPPLVALRNEVARLRDAIETHRTAKQVPGSFASHPDRQLWAALNDQETP